MNFIEFKKIVFWLFKLFVFGCFLMGALTLGTVAFLCTYAS